MLSFKKEANMQENKVISSKITRAQKPLQNNLYDLITVTPATPTKTNYDKELTCNFQPVTGKTYVPKKRIRLSKVKTVRDIRMLFESDIAPDLSKDLEKQQAILLKKITCGSRSEKTKDIARNMLKCGKPVSRSSWQMLMNVNPEGHPHSIQYVLWNGRRIRVNGSKGGKNTFLCNYDLSHIKKPTAKKTNNLKVTYKRKGLLKDSLTVKFKPGPLTKKVTLDESYQKYNVGKTELVNLPKPGLDILPVYGVALEPAIVKYVQNLQDANGKITEKWAEFAVSVLGTARENEVFQVNDKSCVTFELNYKRTQRQLLMRNNVDNTQVKYNTAEIQLERNHDTNLIEVKNILKDMLDSVEISLQQDHMFIDDEPIEIVCEEETINAHNSMKEKTKKKYVELDRLDVTVIRLPDVLANDTNKTCTNAHCSLGCVCASLQCSYHLKQHCGRLECMFECKCDFSRYKVTDAFENDCSGLLPGLINLDNELSSKLTKEEQKFHQTVVVTGEKSILLKPERRNWKATKRYGNFYDSMSLKNDLKERRILSVVDVKLNCENVEPWCMIHNLYKCYCKGKFTELPNSTAIDEDKINKTVSHNDEFTASKIVSSDIKGKILQRSDIDSNKQISTETIDPNSVISTDNNMWDNTTSARTRRYKGRKYQDAYYITTNKRILEMEQNDDQLKKRMMMALNKNHDSDTSNNSSNAVLLIENEKGQNNIESSDDNSCFEHNMIKPMESSTENLISRSLTSKPKPSQVDTWETTETSAIDSVISDRSILNTSTNKAKLIAWLESSYKQYKKRIEQGIVKKSLDPPKHGKVALYPWEFILSRYSERKNLFLISKTKPFRIFMAVDAKNAFFSNCINIDDIGFADLHRYPVTVTNLITNATNLNDNFCILCGLAHCWELIGSVTKVDDQTSGTDQLQSVADDGKIGFVAQDREQNVIGEPKNTDATEAHSKKSEEIQTNDTKYPENSNKGKKRKLRNRLRRFGRSKKSKINKNKSKDGSKDDMIKTKDSIKVDDNKECLQFTTIHKEIAHASTTESMMSPCKNRQFNIAKESENSISNEITQGNEMQIQEIPDTGSDTEMNLQSSTSKWFVMSVENDFSEIQFYKRGFFVKYESIIKAINVARMSGKTVRLSSQKGGDPSSGPQFGIYAIPNSTEYYVFIGPYDKDEPLGIETVKTFTDIRKTMRTKGVWITTKKVDNVKVIDNPLSFMPDNLHATNIVSLENETIQNKLTENNMSPQKAKVLPDVGVTKNFLNKNPIKLVKPIKIRKTNGFYQLAPKGFFAQVSKPNERNSCIMGTAPNSLLQPVIIQKRPTEGKLNKIPMMESMLKKISDDGSQNTKPVAEIAPQIKIVDVYSQSTTVGRGVNTAKKTEQGGMLILKPEEINKRLIENTLMANSEQPSSSNVAQDRNENMDQDIENFLATSSVYVPPNADIFEISDEDDDQDPLTDRNNWQHVWIECETADLGYIQGRKNIDNMISFEFPGFKFTEFYPEEEAFSKINQVISRKIYVPKSITLRWRVCETPSDLTRKYEIRTEFLGPDFVLTRRGVRHKQDLIFGGKNLLKTSTSQKPPQDNIKPDKMTIEEVDKAIDMISELEEKSKLLEEESDKLMTEFTKMKPGIKSLCDVQDLDRSPSDPNNKTTQLTRTLHDIASDNNNT